MSGYEREKRNVLRRCLKTASDGAWKVIPCAGAENWKSSSADCRDYRDSDWRNCQKTAAVVLTGHRRGGETRLQSADTKARFLQIHDHMLPSGECGDNRTTQPTAYNRLAVTVSVS